MTIIINEIIELSKGPGSELQENSIFYDDSSITQGLHIIKRKKVHCSKSCVTTPDSSTLHFSRLRRQNSSVLQ